MNVTTVTGGLADAYRLGIQRFLAATRGDRDALLRIECQELRWIFNECARRYLLDFAFRRC